MAATTILAVGRIVGGDVHLHVTPPALLMPVTEADIDALLDEVYGKPGLGIEDSAGLFDVVDIEADAYALGEADYAAGRYGAPTTSNAEHDAYIRGYNDAWAAQSNVRWWRKGSN